jgi:hypothetical protein
VKRAVPVKRAGPLPLGKVRAKTFRLSGVAMALLREVAAMAGYSRVGCGEQSDVEAPVGDVIAPDHEGKAEGSEAGSHGGAAWRTVPPAAR